MIDAHCHIDQFQNPSVSARKAEERKIITIAVTSLPEHFNLGYQHLTHFKYVRLALGFHPMLVGKHRFDEYLFRSLSQKTSYIGEVGLDFTDKDPLIRQKQVDILVNIIKLVNDRPRFLSLHSRRAENCLYDILSENNIKQAVFHWYSGPLKLIDNILKSGHVFSINPAMIKSRNGRKIIERIPVNRVLTETDGPYVKVNGRPAEPEHVSNVISYLSQVWNRSTAEVSQQIESNFMEIMREVKKGILE